VSEEQRRAFAILSAGAPIQADLVQALASPEVAGGEKRIFNLHAPSLLRYSLPREAIRLKGTYGVHPNAYSSDNKTPTDGAMFIVRVVSPDGQARRLLKRWLRPSADPSHRGSQSLDLPLDGLESGSRLELEISPGPDGNMASDWTYWSDLILEFRP
jgi:hypothetical protein